MAETSIPLFSGIMVVDSSASSLVKDIPTGEYYNPRLFNGEYYYCIGEYYPTDRPTWKNILYIKYNAIINLKVSSNNLILTTDSGHAMYSTYNGSESIFDGGFTCQMTGYVFELYQQSSPWVISNDTPYKQVFPKMIKIADHPKTAWVIYDDIPTKDVYPEMIKFTDTPKSTWIISNDLPYKQSYPNMIKFTGTPKGIWSIQKTDDDFYNIPYKSSFEKVSRPRRLKKLKYKEYSVVLFDYDQTITLRKDVIL